MRKLRMAFASFYKKEESKKFTWWVAGLMTLHMVVTLAMLIINPQLFGAASQFFTASFYFYLPAYLAYFGKAGYENGKKIPLTIEASSPESEETAG